MMVFKAVSRKKKQKQQAAARSGSGSGTTTDADAEDKDDENDQHLHAKTGEEQDEHEDEDAAVVVASSSSSDEVVKVRHHLNGGGDHDEPKHEASIIVETNKNEDIDDDAAGNEEEEEEDLDQMLQDLDIDNDFDLLNNSISREESIGLHLADDDKVDNHDDQKQRQMPSNNNGSSSTTSMSNGQEGMAEVVLREDGSTHVQVVHEQTQKQKPDPPRPDTINEQKRRKKIQLYVDRWERDELFSKVYRPSKLEEMEIQQLEQSLLGKQRSRLFLFGSSNHSKNNIVESKEWKSIMRPSDNGHNHPSVILFQGDCLMQQPDSKKDDENDNDDEEPEELCQVTLSTRGLVILGGFENNGTDPRQVRALVPMSTIEFVEPSLDNNKNGSCWKLHLRQGGSAAAVDNNNNTNGDEQTKPSTNNTVFTFANNSDDDDDDKDLLWLEAMELALIRFHEHYDADKSDTLGWQYKLVYKPGFTEAVTDVTMRSVETMQKLAHDAEGGEGDNNDNKKLSFLDVLDDYHGYAPLHYAVRCHNEHALEFLLQAGADPNIVDGDGHTPMFWVYREELSQKYSLLLQEYGATPPSKSIEQQATLQSELFGQVQNTEKKLQQQKKELEQQRKAEAAQTEMNRNMQLLQQRGEQIDELGDKSKQLNTNAQEYASLAKQLKEASRKKNSKWLPFG